MPTDSSPSGALRRVAEQEQTRIVRVRARLEARHGSLRDELRDLETQLAELDDRERLLEQLLEPGREEAPQGDPPAHASPALKGAQLREHAARVLFRAHGARSPVHYKDWFGLVAGDADISGKDPLAAFLTNVARSPVVKRADAAGTYYIDPDALGALRAELAERQAELHDLTEVTAREVSPSATLRAHRSELLSAIRRLESEVGEAERVLAPPPSHTASIDDAVEAGEDAQATQPGSERRAA